MFIMWCVSEYKEKAQVKFEGYKYEHLEGI